MTVGFVDATAVVAFEEGVCTVDIEGTWTPTMIEAMVREFEVAVHKKRVAAFAARSAQRESDNA